MYKKNININSELPWLNIWHLWSYLLADPLKLILSTVPIQVRDSAHFVPLIKGTYHHKLELQYIEAI